MAAKKAGAGRRPKRGASDKSDRELEAALARFNHQARRLVLAYMEEDRLTPTLRRDAQKLHDDVNAWRSRTGRDEIRVTRSTVKALERFTAPDDEWTCSNCEWIMVSRGRLCFLVGCDPAYKNCSYVCMEKPTNHENVAARPRRKG